MSNDDDSLEVSRVIRATPERVFAAWTDPALIVKWWGAGDVRCTEAEMDLRVGGTYRIANQTPDGSTQWITGAFNRVDRPHRLSYTWAMEPTGADTQFSQVDVTFDAVDEATLVTVQQTQIATPSAREVHLHGWIGCLDGLERVLNAGHKD